MFRRSNWDDRGDGCKLLPRPVDVYGVGDVMRKGGCMLALRPCPGVGESRIVGGINGTGGASSAAGVCLAGEGARNDLSAIEPLLSLRCNMLFGLPFTEPFLELPIDELRRIMRFVCTLATSVGVVGLDRNAAPAAAAAKLLFDAFP